MPGKKVTANLKTLDLGVSQASPKIGNFDGDSSNKVANSAGKQWNDIELKQLMIDLLLKKTTFRLYFKDSTVNILKCYDILRSDKDFARLYSDTLYQSINDIEEDLLLGVDLDNIPLKYDKMGNADLALGYLKKAELKIKNAQWVLERRNKLYQAKSQQDITTDGQALNAVILPSKMDKQTDEE